MTTTVTSAQTGPLTANGVTPLPFSFQAISASEISVTRNGVIVLPSTYTVTLNANGTGSITPTSSWGNDAVIITSAPNYQQPVGFNRFGAFYPDQLNPALDRLSRQIIALKGLPNVNSAYTDEQVRDVIGASLVAGTNVTIAVNDATDTITISAAGGAGATDPEVVRDTVALALRAGPNVTITNDDVADTITISSTSGGVTDPEIVRDTMAAALVAGTNITITPNDLADTITIAAASAPAYTDEQVRDVMGLALVAGANITVTPNDAGDTITVAAPSTPVSTPMTFGAVGDGVTDDTANFLNALQSGNVIDGLGKTYALSAELNPTSFKGLRNAKFKWVNTAAMTTQGRSLLHIHNLNDWFVHNCAFDMGTVEDIGATGAPDNVRGGLTVTGAPYCNRVEITSNEGFGSGAGTALEIRNIQDSKVLNNHVHDRVLSGSGLTNDSQNGIQLSGVINSVIGYNSITRLYLRVNGVLTKKWARGFVMDGVINSTFIGNKGSFVDQCFDFSGGLPGNRGLTVTGNSASDVGTWGFKFANVCRDFVTTGNTVHRFGLGAFVWSGNAAVGADQTQNHLVVGNYAYDCTGEFNGSSGNGFWILEGSGYPRGIRIYNCGAHDTLGKMTQGFANTATLGNQSHPNSIFNCHTTGQTGAAEAGFHARRAKLSVTQNINSGAAEYASFTTAVENSMGYWQSGTPTRQTIPEAGIYRLYCRVQFAANAAGFRSVGFQVNGQNAGGQAFNAVSGTATTVTFELERSIGSGDYVQLIIEQNSGAVLSTDIFFDVEFVRAA